MWNESERITVRKRSRRRKRIRKWLGLAFCGLLGIGWAVTHRKPYELRCWRFSFQHAPGGARINYYPITVGYGSSHKPLIHMTSCYVPRCSGLDYSKRNTVSMLNPYYWVELPVWCLLLPTVTITAVYCYLDRRRPKGHCQDCGYDLTGNESGVCPECGTKVEQT